MIPFGRVFGFPVSIDFTAIAIVALFALGGASKGPGAAAQGIGMAAVVFGSVLVHELGHAFAARAFRLGPIDITLHGFGGLTRYARAPGPKQGIFVTLAGPLAGLALGVVALPLALFLTGLPGSLADRMATFNLFWSLFNLLPMYPLDGGSVLGYVLALFMPAHVGFRWAARVGLVVAVGVALAALAMGQTFILIICALSVFQSFRVAFSRG